VKDYQRLGPGYYKVERSPQQKRRDYSLTDAEVKDLLAPISSRSVADEIAKKYHKANRSTSKS